MRAAVRRLFWIDVARSSRKGDSMMGAAIRPLNWTLAVAGAIAGGAAGFLVFWWLLWHGFYAMMIPGAALGLAGGSLLKGRSQVFGVVCGVAALVLGIFAEWWTGPWADDPSLGYFLTHLQDLSSVTQIMIVLGGVFGYWFGQGRTVAGQASARATETET
jgi:hypothetical protein